VQISPAGGGRVRRGGGGGRGQGSRVRVGQQGEEGEREGDSGSPWEEG
jgi:hypothetical protein